MIKKSLFAEELAAGMQRELQPFEKKAAMQDLGKAAEYLHSAAQIFEEAGMTAKADRVLRILAKIALDSNEAKKHPENKEFYEKMMGWFKDPHALESGDEISITSLMPTKELPPGEDLVFKSIMDDNGADDNDARKPRKPKNPTRVSDRHTQGLTSEQMIANLEGHGTVFNMADDGAADDLLDLDINDAAMEVFENGEEDKTFEEEDSQ